MLFFKPSLFKREKNHRLKGNSETQQELNNFTIKMKLVIVATVVAVLVASAAGRPEVGKAFASGIFISAENS